MREIVGEWISNLAIIAILAALVDMILPNGNLRKYTGFIFGLIILIMFLHPLLQFANQAPQLEREVYRRGFNQQSQAAQWQSVNVDKNQLEQLNRMVREKLEQELAMELEYKMELDNPNVSIVFGQKNGETDFSDIQSIRITASQTDRAAFIEPVVIDTEKESVGLGKVIDGVDSEKMVEIREYVSKLYEIDATRIDVNGQ